MGATATVWSKSTWELYSFEPVDQTKVVLFLFQIKAFNILEPFKPRFFFSGVFHLRTWQFHQFHSVSKARGAGYSIMWGDLPYPEHRRVVDVEVILGGGGSGNAVAARLFVNVADCW